MVLALLCAPAFGQTTAFDWDNKGNDLKGQGKYDEAIQAYSKAIEIDPQDELGWNLKADLLNKLGRTIEANAVNAKIKELKNARTTTVLDHSMASNIDDSTRSVITRTREFSVDDNKAYSWLSLGNVAPNAVWWYWYSPAGNLMQTDRIDIPAPTNGASNLVGSWSAYNVWSHMDIAGHYAANLSGDWHVKVFLQGSNILTEYFSVSGGQPR
jgi:tetratricopeptide (TPR) repeat protein